MWQMMEIEFQSKRWGKYPTYVANGGNSRADHRNSKASPLCEFNESRNEVPTYVANVGNSSPSGPKDVANSQDGAN